MATSYAPVIATHTMAAKQTRAIAAAAAKQNGENNSQFSITASDEPLTQPYFVYIYNILDREWVVNQPPFFPKLVIPRCPKGKLASWNKIGAWLLEAHNKVGTYETFYKKVDGRKVASSLLNPSCLPNTSWEAQLATWTAADGMIEMYGNNLNLYGVFWSLTAPDNVEKLSEEVKVFRERANKTLQDLITQAELFAAQNDLKMISPLMHFAMDYFGKTAAWHMSAVHKINCPNCGDLVVDGIAYHRNSFGEKCVIDMGKYKELMRRQRQAELEAAAIDSELEAEIPKPTPKRAPVQEPADQTEPVTVQQRSAEQAQPVRRNAPKKKKAAA